MISYVCLKCKKWFHEMKDKQPDGKTCSECGGKLIRLTPEQSKPSADTNETVSLNCPSCENRLKVSAKLVGKRGKCPKCSVTFPIVLRSEVKAQDAESLANQILGEFEDSHADWRSTSADEIDSAVAKPRIPWPIERSLPVPTVQHEQPRNDSNSPPGSLKKRLHRHLIIGVSAGCIAVAVGLLRFHANSPPQNQQEIPPTLVRNENPEVATTSKQQPSPKAEQSDEAIAALKRQLAETETKQAVFVRKTAIAEMNTARENIATVLGKILLLDRAYRTEMRERDEQGLTLHAIAGKNPFDPESKYQQERTLWIEEKRAIIQKKIDTELESATTKFRDRDFPKDLVDQFITDVKKHIATIESEVKTPYGGFDEAWKKALAAEKLRQEKITLQKIEKSKKDGAALLAYLDKLPYGYRKTDIESLFLWLFSVQRHHSEGTLKREITKRGCVDNRYISSDDMALLKTFASSFGDFRLNHDPKCPTMAEALAEYNKLIFLRIEK